MFTADEEDRLFQIFRFEDNEMDDSELPGFFQGLIDRNVIWTLNLKYQKTAKALVEAGRCVVRDVPKWKY